MKLSDIQGIGPAYAAKLAKAGIRTTGALLKQGATPEGRKQIVSLSGVGHSLILAWVNKSDLYRVKGVGSQFSGLIEKSGVDTVVELSKRTGKNLYDTMQKVNAKENLVNRMPTLAQVEDWVKQAKKLPRVIKY